MTYLVKKYDRYFKRRYDPWNGHLTDDPKQAVTFKTMKGAEAFAQRKRDYEVLARVEAAITVVSIEEKAA